MSNTGVESVNVEVKEEKRYRKVRYMESAKTRKRPPERRRATRTSPVAAGDGKTRKRKR